MAGVKLLFVALPLLLLPTGCFNGIFNGTFDEALGGTFNGTINGGLYSHTIEPLTINREPTETGNGLARARGDINQIQYPLTVISIRVGRNGLGDVARKHGLTTVYYADIEKRSILFGIWQQQIIHVYGR